MRNFSKIILLFLFSTSVFAQGVCDKTGVEIGGFTFDGPAAVCKGQEIKIKDNSGGTEIKYIYGYQGEDASKLAGINSTTDLKYTFIAAGSYVILQYGKKNGKEMYFCNVAVVRESNEPKFSYNSCGDNFLTIIIPKDVSNNFDYYEIDWGDGKPVEKVTTLPFKNYRNYSTSTPTRNIRVEGFFNSPNNCPRVSQLTVPMRHGGNFVSIAQVQLTDDQKEAIITLKGSDDEYDFYQRGRNDNFKVGKPDLKTLPGTFKIKIVDTVQTCFTAIRNSGCTEIAGEVCTVKLESVSASGKDNDIKWNLHPLCAPIAPCIVALEMGSVLGSLKLSSTSLKIFLRCGGTLPKASLFLVLRRMVSLTRLSWCSSFARNFLFVWVWLAIPKNISKRLPWSQTWAI